MPNLPDLSQLKLNQPSETTPSTDWILIPNGSSGWTYLMVPAAGSLYVNYEPFPQYAAQIYVGHQTGPITPINVGENTITVAAGDVLLYQLTNPGSDAIKLFFQLT